MEWKRGIFTDHLHSITTALTRLGNILGCDCNMMHSSAIGSHLLGDGVVPVIFLLGEEVVCLEAKY